MEKLFRGKRIDNGEWIEGYYSWYDLIAVELGIEPGTGFADFEEYEIIPDTVSQYTGLKDKTGSRIWHGSLCTDMVGDIFEVFYNTAHCAYMASYTRTADPEKLRGCFRLGDCCSVSIEVIGNRWDNPELMEG